MFGRRSKEPPRIWVMIQGNEGVGKSAMTIQYIQGHFITNYAPNIGDSYLKSEPFIIDGKPFYLSLWDSGGDEESSVMMYDVAEISKGFMFVYDITSRESFEALGGWCDAYLETKKVKTRNELCAIICGNKCDLADQRQVETSEGQAFAGKYGFDFLETSAKTCHNLEKAFMTIAIRCASKNDNEDDDKKKKSNCIIC